MTDEIIAIDEAKRVKPKKEKPEPCQCKSKTPVLETFMLDNVRGTGTLQGNYCPDCYDIKGWAFVPNDISEPTVRSEKKAKVKKEPVMKIVAPETTEQVTEALVASITAEQADAVIAIHRPETSVETAPESALELTPVPEPLQRYFPIVSVNPVDKIADQIAFMLTKDGLPFTIKVKNSPEKVTDAVNNPSKFVGKFVELDYAQTDERGFPVDPKMKSLKTKDEVNQILEPVTQ